MKYQIIDYHDEDKWIEYKGDMETPKRVALELAEKLYRDDPCDPSDFECVVKFKPDSGEIRIFDVVAETFVDFFAYPQQSKEGEG